MAATPPSLTTPPPPPLDHAGQPPFLPRHDYDLFSFIMPPNDTNTTAIPSLDGAMSDQNPAPRPAAENTAAVESTSQQPPTNAQAPNGDGSQHHENEGSNSDDDDDDDDDSEYDDGGRGDLDGSWYSILEEKREPVEDELRYWQGAEEHSAADHAYWEGKAFTDLEDPELKPAASGRIDFTIDRFNGTREKPNKETVMRSDTVDIGGYTWRLKVYPKGNNTDHLSVYLENVTMQAENWQSREAFSNPPLPFLSSTTKPPKKRRCVAAQVCVVVYNPTEPRQYEDRVDAHQFTKSSPDYGWTRFTRMRRRDLGLRNHFQRAPLLQDDKLAFKAYIRVIEDPTGCLWNHTPSRYSNTISTTGLRPFSPMLPMIAADLVLLHFAPFRDLVYKWQQATGSSRFATWMNTMLWKMLSRERSELYGEPVDCKQSDAVGWLQRARKCLQEEVGAEVTSALLGSLVSGSGAAVGGGRLRTSRHASVQAAVDAHDAPLDTPVLLTLELERQQFDREKRQWKRIANKVDMPDDIKVGDNDYKLFAFITHEGELSSKRFKTYVRPQGPGSLWYGYKNGEVTSMTHKQAVEKRCGRDSKDESKWERSLFSFGGDRRGGGSFYDEQEVAHVVFYVRNDITSEAFKQQREVAWTPPPYLRDAKETRQADATSAANDVTVVEEKGVPQELGLSTTEGGTQGSDNIAGCATPTHWYMDDEGDVVMSDTEVETAPRADPAEPELVHGTIDNLGCPYYSGEMLGSEYHGQGNLIATTGDQYTGTFSHGQKHGMGKMIYATNGNTYEGEWAHDERHGSGKYIEASTGNIFDGHWKNDKKSGSFTLTGTVTEEDKGVCGICYEKDINCAFYDCGHVVACFACAQQIEDCPVCRRRIVSRLQLYGVRVSVE